MIWSSRERNRSCSLVSRRSRGRIANRPLHQLEREESRLAIRGNPQNRFARKSPSKGKKPANSITCARPVIQPIQWLLNFSRTTNSLLGIKPTMVPFNGGAPATNALVGGQIDYIVTGIADIGQQVQTGTIKAYAVAATERHPILPNVPTTIEAGLPEFQALPWWALFAPKGVPQPILDALTDALDKALDEEHVRKRFSDLGGDIPGKERRGQQPLAALVKSEIARWTPIIKAANVKIG